MSARPTKGPWAVEPGTNCVWGPCHDLYDTRTWGANLLEAKHSSPRYGYRVSQEEAEANAAFIVEAGTAYHETGLTPRQLVDQNADLADQKAELLAALEGVMSILGRAESNASGFPEFDYVGPLVANARAVIAKCKAGAA